LIAWKITRHHWAEARALAEADEIDAAWRDSALPDPDTRET
jgi:hypothetical protein